MAYRPIPNPYVVLWHYNHEQWDEVASWLTDNMEGYFFFASFGQGGQIVTQTAESKAEWESKKTKTNAIMAHFENPKDALIFKLTWGGDNGQIASEESY